MIGKKHKLSRGGHPSGFVPDDRHSVDVTGGSERFGSCGRAASDGDSCAPNGRSVDLDREMFDALGVPSQVISFSKMPSSERRKIEERLRMELEQIQAFEKSVVVNCSEPVVSSPSSGIHQQQQNKKKKLNDSHPTDPPVPQRAKCGVPNKSGAAKNGGLNAMAMKRCGFLLQKLMSHSYSSLFNAPVDIVRWNIPDYFNIIKHPMDLGTVKSKLSSGAYSSLSEFSSDVRLTFSNAMTYNPPKNDVHLMARTLSRTFEANWKSIEKSFSTLPRDSVTTRENGDAKSAQHANVEEIPPKESPFDVPSKSAQRPNIGRIPPEESSFDVPSKAARHPNIGKIPPRESSSDVPSKSSQRPNIGKIAPKESSLDVPSNAARRPNIGKIPPKESSSDVPSKSAQRPNIGKITLKESSLDVPSNAARRPNMGKIPPKESSSDVPSKSAQRPNIGKITPRESSLDIPSNAARRPNIGKIPPKGSSSDVPSKSAQRPNIGKIPPKESSSDVPSKSAQRPNIGKIPPKESSSDVPSKSAQRSSMGKIPPKESSSDVPSKSARLASMGEIPPKESPFDVPSKSARHANIGKIPPKESSSDVPSKSAQRASIGKVLPKESSSDVPSKSLDAAVKKKMTEQDKRNLSTRLMSLVEELPVLPVGIIGFLRRYTSDQTNEDEVELDIEILGDDALHELQSLLDKHLEDKKMPADDACPMENDSPEEDVDIGGNDDPLPCYPPVTIEKDGIVKNNGYSSFSSDSGSSSSDSDSSSSSESEHEEKLGSQVAMDRHKSDVMRLGDEKCFPGTSVQLQRHSHTNTTCHRESGLQMGENATSERQVSPEKRYQNALKVNRFAETILKAREKTFNKKDRNGGREKLQHEREEFARLQREEKARLQAEAKVAEEAQRRAQAVEVKRQREKEREAARQALLQMEKTVEINENSTLLKDFEMLQHDVVEQLPSSLDKTSSDLSPDGICSFKLGGSNPLEKLGLFIKVDEDEEEDMEPAQHPVEDVEEGEIH